jgi:methyltransferase family protein
MQTHLMITIYGYNLSQPNEYILFSRNILPNLDLRSAGQKKPPPARPRWPAASPRPLDILPSGVLGKGSPAPARVQGAGSMKFTAVEVRCPDVPRWKEPDAWQRRETPIGGTTPRDFLRNPQRRLRRFLERWIIAREEIRSLLDVGSNAGIEGWRLRAAGYRGRYVGLDSNRKALAAGRREIGSLEEVGFVQGDAGRLPFPDRAFDCVLVKDVLEHLPHYRHALREIARVTGRHLIIALFLPLAREERLVRHADGYWMNRYGRGPFLRFLEGDGFELMSSRKIWRPWTRDEVLLFQRTDDEWTADFL